MRLWPPPFPAGPTGPGCSRDAAGLTAGVRADRRIGLHELPVAQRARRGLAAGLCGGLLLLCELRRLLLLCGLAFHARGHLRRRLLCRLLVLGLCGVLRGCLRGRGTALGCRAVFLCGRRRGWQLSLGRRTVLDPSRCSILRGILLRRCRLLRKQHRRRIAPVASPRGARPPRTLADAATLELPLHRAALVEAQVHGPPAERARGRALAAHGPRDALVVEAVAAVREAAEICRRPLATVLVTIRPCLKRLQAHGAGPLLGRRGGAATRRLLLLCAGLRRRGAARGPLSGPRHARLEARHLVLKVAGHDGLHDAPVPGLRLDLQRLVGAVDVLPPRVRSGEIDDAAALHQLPAELENPKDEVDVLAGLVGVLPAKQHPPRLQPRVLRV
mmetsp:Transcript_82804/g.257223  ORF Transcript_82804/g.257223 Transcript_82804/m.257223 type:complete len:387 (+) Transcript_82804:1-1161(+)